MTDKDWTPDDLLDFHYDHPAPKHEEKLKDDFDIFDEFDAIETKESSSNAVKTRRGLDDSFDSYDEFKRSEKIEGRSIRQHGRHPGEDALDALTARWKREPASESKIESIYEAPIKVKPEDIYDDSIFEEYDREHASAPGPVEEVDQQKPMPSARELKALRQASREAHDRYRSNYTKGHNKRMGREPLSKGHKLLMILYTATLAAFAGSMTAMNVLPFGMLIALYVILALITLLILVQTRKRNIKKWGRRAATILAVVLILFYSVGTAYSLGTLSFLSHTSVDNSRAVAGITKEPFNVVVTGMDVKGEIDKQGRSDVNMVLTINPATATVLMTSIPRDYEIYMPDHDNQMDKLTHTGFYSVDTTILAEEELLGMSANYYVKVNFTTVEKFIDAIGGVDVYSEYEFNPVKMKDWTVQEGMNI